MTSEEIRLGLLGAQTAEYLLGKKPRPTEEILASIVPLSEIAVAMPSPEKEALRLGELGAATARVTMQ